MFFCFALVSVHFLFARAKDGGNAPLFSCLSKRKGEEKRRTQEGEDFDFFPLLTPLIETMKEGDTPSFKSPLRCTEKEAFFLRTSFPAGDRGLPLPGAEEGRTQSLQPQPLFPVEARDVEGAVSCPGNAAVALPQGGGKAKILCCLRGGKRDILIYYIMRRPPTGAPGGSNR